MRSFFSRGKLLLTAEYAVLDGAQALAIPTKTGQTLSVEPISEPFLEWKSYDFDGTLWYETRLALSDIFNPQFSSEDGTTKMLLSIFREISSIKGQDFFKNSGFRVETRLSFPRVWGFGTSSTLISNISDWLEVNPYELLQKTFGGSGYDIACAKSNTPIFFSLSGNEPRVHPTSFQFPESGEASLIYLNQKQNSREAIQQFRQRKPFELTELEQINAISLELTLQPDAELFEELLLLHEHLLSEVLGQTRIQERLFPDYPGVVKSLGAWGGDFVLAFSKECNNQNYFKNKGFHTILNPEEVLKL